jgi:hypothetical protein
MKKHCGNCKFYLDDDRKEQRAGTGFCRRYPKPIKTRDIRWCGEHIVAAGMRPEKFTTRDESWVAPDRITLAPTEGE